jgi:hypothetical protein
MYESVYRCYVPRETEAVKKYRVGRPLILISLPSSMASEALAREAMMLLPYSNRFSFGPVKTNPDFS